MVQLSDMVDSSTHERVPPWSYSFFKFDSELCPIFFSIFRLKIISYFLMVLSEVGQRPVSDVSRPVGDLSISTPPGAPFKHTLKIVKESTLIKAKIILPLGARPPPPHTPPPFSSQCPVQPRHFATQHHSCLGLG